MRKNKKISNPKVISRIKGGLGNQLFCYAAARRLALINDAELVIDDVTGFARDYQYRRRYGLDHFNIPVRKATPSERLEPFERYRRAYKKWRARSIPFGQRRYVEQKGLDFDERLLRYEVEGTVYLDGYWQSEGYFKDIEQVIREDLKITPPEDAQNLEMAGVIRSTNAVALHVRWFDVPGVTGVHNLSMDYYKRALCLMDTQVDDPHYFVFSDDSQAVQERLDLPLDKVTFINHNHGDKNAYADLWLMTQCRHFISANSTFSWWGAWLGDYKDKIIMTPKVTLEGKAAWGFPGLIPIEWKQV